MDLLTYQHTWDKIIVSEMVKTANNRWPNILSLLELRWLRYFERENVDLASSVQHLLNSISIIFCFLSELLGITGMILFSINEYQVRGNFGRLSWGHALCDSGLAVSLIGSILMACSQQSPLPITKAASGRYVATGKPGYDNLHNKWVCGKIRQYTVEPVSNDYCLCYA